MKKNILKFLICLVFLLLLNNKFLILQAHQALLDVEYDDCVIAQNEDGNDERWYFLLDANKSVNIPHVYSYSHISDSITTLKYYFSPATWIQH